jgi:hypothetical protein
MNGSLWIVNGNANGDPSDLDVLGSVFIGGSGSSSYLGVTKEAEVDIDGNLIIGQDGVGTFYMLGVSGGGPTRLEAVDPLAGLCAIGRTYDGNATVGAYSMLRCQTLELGQAGTGTLGTGTLIVNGGFVRVLDVLRVGAGTAGSGGPGWLEMSWDRNEAVVATNGTYIAPNGGILGDGKLYVGALGLIIEGVLSPGIIVTFPLAAPAAGRAAIAQTPDVMETLTVSGTVTFRPTGRLEIPLAGRGAGQYGSLGVTGQATLDGVLALDFRERLRAVSQRHLYPAHGHGRHRRRLRQRRDQRPAARPRLPVDHRQRAGEVQVAGRAAAKDLSAVGPAPALAAETRTVTAHDVEENAIIFRSR